LHLQFQIGIRLQSKNRRSILPDQRVSGYETRKPSAPAISHQKQGDQRVSGYETRKPLTDFSVSFFDHDSDRDGIFKKKP
jgi:hypothetical protein